MESGSKPRKKRVEREDVSGHMLTTSLIGEIDRLEAIGKQAGHAAEIYRHILDSIKDYKLQVDTDALDAKEKEFATAFGKQIKLIRATSRTVRTALWLLIVMLFLCFAVGYCYLEAHPWKAKYLQLVQQYNNLQQRSPK